MLFFVKFFFPLFTVASAPSGLRTVQKGLSIVQIIWNLPTPLGDTTGYRIDYRGGSRGYVVIDSSTRSLILMDLLNGSRYNISIVGISEHIYSDTISVEFGEFVFNFTVYALLYPMFLYSTSGYTTRPDSIS